MLKKVMKVAQDYRVFNYGPPRPQNNVKSQGIMIVTGTGTNFAPKCFLPRNSKEKVGKEISLYASLMDKLETSLATTVDNAHGDTGGEIVERYIKPIASTIFDHLVYFLDGPGPLIKFQGLMRSFSTVLSEYGKVECSSDG